MKYLLIVVGVISMGLTMYSIDSWKCARRWRGALDSKYIPWQGCMVNLNGRWIPEGNVIFDANGGSVGKHP